MKISAHKRIDGIKKVPAKKGVSSEIPFQLPKAPIIAEQSPVKAQPFLNESDQFAFSIASGGYKFMYANLKRPMMIAVMVELAFLAAFPVYAAYFNSSDRLLSEASIAHPNSAQLVVTKRLIQTHVVLNQEQIKPGLPTRLRIPSLAVDAKVDQVGVTSGVMDAPKTGASVGWYKYGARPGEIGSAVIDGHYNWLNNTPAVFTRLSDLKTGDEIYVQDDQGHQIEFIVRTTQTYDWNEKESDLFTSKGNDMDLTLITCSGAWNEAKQTYSKRFAVFAEAVKNPSKPRSN